MPAKMTPRRRDRSFAARISSMASRVSGLRVDEKHQRRGQVLGVVLDRQPRSVRSLDLNRLRARNAREDAAEQDRRGPAPASGPIRPRLESQRELQDPRIAGARDFHEIAARHRGG